ncbi:MAG: 1-phosphofructokinase family hexose kinase [Longimicrobiales bacterium]
MILTITPNPSLDYLFETGRLQWDDANRMDPPRRRPGGQGINVTRAARALGASSVAVALLGGRVGAELADTLSAEGTPFERIDITGETRVFVGARESETGRSMLLNPGGPHIATEEAQRVSAVVIETIRRLKPKWVAVCGSIPPGLPVELYAQSGEAARRAGARFVPDCDGDALRLAVQCADLVVPNRHEAERLLDVRIDNVESAGDAARRLTQLGPGLAAITLGEDGAVLSDGQAIWHAAPARLNSGSAVGAGDAFLAALLIEIENNSALDVALRKAVAAGASVLRSSGSDLLSLEHLQEIQQNVKARPLV